MGGFGIWHWVILLLAAGIAVSVVGLLIRLVARAARRPGPLPPASWITATAPPSTAARLQEPTALCSHGLVSDARYEHSRTALLRDLQTCT